MTDLDSLQKAVKKSGLKKSHIADQMGMNPKTLWRKLSGQTEFTLSEADKLGEVLGMNQEEKRNIFFN